MNKACYENGECVICGCQTTALQMANKACDQPCYPEMMDKKLWRNFRSGLPFYDLDTRIEWWWTTIYIVGTKNQRTEVLYKDDLLIYPRQDV